VIGPDRVKIGTRSGGLASTEGYKGCAEVFGVGKLYRWFVKDFVRIAKPLHEIIRKVKLRRKTVKGSKRYLRS